MDLEREVSTEEGQKLAEMYGIPFFESSAKENIGIDQFMRKIIEDVVMNLNNVKKGVELQEETIKNNEKGGCSC
jgi:hypothetical protein